MYMKTHPVHVTLPQSLPSKTLDREHNVMKEKENGHASANEQDGNKAVCTLNECTFEADKYPVFEVAQPQLCIKVDSPKDLKKEHEQENDLGNGHHLYIKHKPNQEWY